MSDEPISIETKKEEKRTTRFQRQAVLIEEVIGIQLKCPHTLAPIGNTVIVCSECGAMWVK